MAIFAELFLGSYLLHLQSKVATLELNCCRIGVLQLVYIGTFVYTVCSESSDVHKLKYTYSTAIKLDRRDFKYVTNYTNL